MRRAMAICGAVLAGASPAAADQILNELKTGGVEFILPDQVEIAEEKLFISPDVTRVEYRLHNASAKSFETYASFPMPDIAGSLDGILNFDPAAGSNFLGLEITQNGAKPDLALQQRASVNGVDLTADLNAAHIPLVPSAALDDDLQKSLSAATIASLEAHGLITLQERQDEPDNTAPVIVPRWTLSETYSWKTVIPSRGDVVITASYKTNLGGAVNVTFLNEKGEPKGDTFENYRAGYCLDGDAVKAARDSYAHEKANKGPLYEERWATHVMTAFGDDTVPVGKFTLTIDKGKPENIVSFCGDGVKKLSATAFEMTKADYTPEKDIEVLFLQPSGFPK